MNENNDKKTIPSSGVKKKRFYRPKKGQNNTNSEKVQKTQNLSQNNAPVRQNAQNQAKNTQKPEKSSNSDNQISSSVFVDKNGNVTQMKSQNTTGKSKSFKKGNRRGQNAKVQKQGENAAVSAPKNATPATPKSNDNRTKNGRNVNNTLNNSSKTPKKAGFAVPKTVFSDVTRAIDSSSLKNDDLNASLGNYGKHSKKTSHAKDDGSKLRVFSLGGLQEIGKNMTVIEYGNDIVVVDCGMAFPDEEMPGIDLVIPDVSYLVKNKEKVRGILITHGHEDHVGAISYVLAQMNVPIYGTRLSLGIIEGKLEENPPEFEPDLRTVEAGDTVRLGSMFAEFVHVNHSIADACAISISTPVGTVFHTGDFKLDVSPIDGKMMDLTRIGEIGKAGVTLLLCESTNAERPGFTPSERTVGNSLERIFTQYVDRRLIIATFSSNVHRVQQIIDASHAHGRKVAILGRSMVNVIGAAVELGYMDLPEDTLIDLADMKRYKPEQITLITTGSQGEPMSALYRIAFSEHDKVKLSSSDVVILSSSAIPGNERDVGRIINALVKNGVKVVNDATESVHVSGHACREELKLMMALLKPKYFMPIHGEYRHLYANKENAEYMGIPSENIFVSEIGKVLEIDRKGARFNGNVPAGQVLVDGAGVGDIGAIVLRDRKHLAEDGLVVVVASINSTDRSLVSGPDIVSRGFVYVKESEELMVGARQVATDALESALETSAFDWTEIRNRIKDALSKYIFQKTKRSPMILPVIMDV